VNEPFDVELSRALKEGAAKSLEGWEFTPAMRAKVLERVRTEPAETAPAAPPTKRVDPVRLIRPVAWVAAAAAAFLIVANLGGIERLGGARKEMSTTSAPRQDAAAKPEAPAAAAPAPNATFTQDRQTDQAPAVAAAESLPGSGTAATGAADTSVAQAPAVTAVALTVPARPDGQGPEAATAAAQAAPRTLALKAAVASENIGLAANSSGPVLSLTGTGLRAQAGDGAPVWDRPLADLSPQSLLAEAPDGRAAVANGTNLLYLVGSGGELDRTLNSSAPVEQLLWSNDGRLAAAEGDNVVVYEAATGNAAFTLNAGVNREMAFAPDGLLAVLGDRPNDPHRLVLADQKGTATVEIRPTAVGRGLAFAAGGAVVVAGGHAYSREGRPLWRMPLVTEGVAAGEKQVIGWDAHTVLAVDAQDGHAVWKADWQGEGPGVRKVVLSPDGCHVAVVAPLEDGAAFWILDNAGKVLYAERLPQMPVDVSFAGNQVVLLMPQSVIYRSIP
jgi:hypothetical protein